MKVLIIEDEVPNYIFIDVRLPDVDGIEFLKKIREIGSTSVVVIVLAFAEKENIVEALNLGVLDKPFTQEKLIEVYNCARIFIDSEKETQKTVGFLSKMVS